MVDLARKTAKERSTQFRTKLLTADRTTTGVMTDLSYTLEAGKTYRITGQFLCRNPAAVSTLIVDVKDGATVIASLTYNESTNVDSSIVVTTIRTMVGTALTFDVTTNSNTSTVRGNNTLNRTFVIVEELPNHEVTVAW